MPELPEVENIAINLSNILPGKKITQVIVFAPKLRKPIPVEKFSLISDSAVCQVTRRGKYIIINLSNGYNLIFHLGMSGRIKARPFEGKAQELQDDKHHHLTVLFEDNYLLSYHDPRKFGLVEVISELQFDQCPLFKNIGTDPLAESFSIMTLSELLKRGKSNIKSFLMDQKYVSGIGNIYASEILFEAKISPYSITNKLTELQINSLYVSIINILQKAIQHGGSTLKDYYHPDDKKGQFQNLHKVYNKGGKRCPECNSLLIKIVQNGRSTFYCPICQPLTNLGEDS